MHKHMYKIVVVFIHWYINFIIVFIILFILIIMYLYIFYRGHHGLVAYGCNTYVVVIDTTNVQPVQCLDHHKSAVNKVKKYEN